MWVREKEGRYIYNFNRNDDGYRLVLTDLHNTYAEDLSFKDIENRGDQLGMPLALGTPHQVSAFLNVILDHLISGEGIDINESDAGAIEIKINIKESGIEFQWLCILEKLDTEKSVSVLGDIINGLIGVVGNMGDELSKYGNTIAEKDMVLSGMDEAMQRRVEYRPPKYLEKVFNDRSIVQMPQSTNPLDIAAKYWPNEVHPILAYSTPPPQSQEQETDAEDMEDSDVTHESFGGSFGRSFASLRGSNETD